MASTAMLLPSEAILSTWTDRDWRRAEGVQLETLDHMQRLIARTYDHAYDIVVHGSRGDVLVRGGRFFQDFTRVILEGSSLGGGFVKQFGIYVGLRLEFNADGETLLTAPIFSIRICPVTLAATA